MADEIFAKELEDELMKYTAKHDYKVKTKVVKTDEVRTNGDLEVNIIECTKSLGNGLVTTELQNTTESSSSFGNSSSSAENVDYEASSEFHGDATSALDINEFSERLRTRKKKLTTHWRSFIQPLMWRCKWVELQIHQLQSKARQYDKKLEVYNNQKQARVDTTLVDAVKSLPFVRENERSDVFKRKKRRRTEATENLTEYMSQHNLFSCRENKKWLTENTFMNNESKNTGAQIIKIDDDIWDNNDLLSLEPVDDDNLVENILRKITSLQSHVGNLKTKVNKIMSENSERLSFAESLNLSPPDNENGIEGTYISSQTTSILPPQTNHTNFPVPNGSIGRARHKSVEAGVVIGSQKVKKEMDNLEEVKIHHPTQMPLELKNESGNTTPSVLSEPDPLTEDQSPPKLRSIAKLTAPRTKRKRGRKKVSTSRRSRRRTSG
ncbi:hypothetical protein ACS0TY_019682 [Phlomoides rotata]